MIQVMEKKFNTLIGSYSIFSILNLSIFKKFFIRKINKYQY